MLLLRLLLRQLRRSRRKCQTRLVSNATPATSKNCLPPLETPLFDHGFTVSSPLQLKFGRQNTHRAWSWNVWVSFSCVGCPRGAEIAGVKCTLHGFTFAQTFAQIHFAHFDLGNLQVPNDLQFHNSQPLRATRRSGKPTGG